MFVSAVTLLLTRLPAVVDSLARVSALLHYGTAGAPDTFLLICFNAVTELTMQIRH